MEDDCLLLKYTLPCFAFVSSPRNFPAAIVITKGSKSDKNKSPKTSYPRPKRKHSENREVIDTILEEDSLLLNAPSSSFALPFFVVMDRVRIV
jgi:hypothetical protein